MQLLHNPIFLLFIVIVSGELIGHIKFKQFSLGSSAVIFTGLAFGHFGFTLPIVFQSLGLVLFIYSVGLQAGPGFLSSFKKQGLKLSIGATIIVFSGFLTTLLCSWLGGFDAGISAGLFSGALTSTPGLAVAVEAVAESQAPAAYGLTYCFGVFGVILFVRLLPRLMKIDLQAEEQQMKEEISQEHPPMTYRHIEVTNPNIYGKTLKEIALNQIAPVVLTRLLRPNAKEPVIVYGDTILQQGDKVRIVGQAAAISKASMLLGQPVEESLEFTQGLTKKAILVSKRSAAGFNVSALNLKTSFDIQIARITRNGIDLAAEKNTRLHLGDILHVVGQEQSIKNVTRMLGNDVRETYRTDLIPIIVGLLIGFLIGQFPIYIPYVGQFKLGLSGGVLLAGLTLSSLYKTGPLIWDIPSTTNNFIRELGLLLFLATVGTRTGETILITLQQQGLTLFLSGMAVTLVPLIVTLFICRKILKIRFLHILGVITGGMTSTPGLASIASLVETPYAASAYATVYPVALISMILLTKILVLIQG